MTKPVKIGINRGDLKLKNNMLDQISKAVYIGWKIVMAIVIVFLLFYLMLWFLG